MPEFHDASHGGEMVALETEHLRPIAFDALRLRGDMERRILANLNRLEERKYQPDHVFLTYEQSNGWDGDTEGRTLLALTLNGQAAHRRPKYLDEIIARLPAHFNERGYLGQIVPAGILNEQQLSGHGWLLRGLCEVVLSTGREDVKAMVARMIETLVLPTAGYHRTYPIDPSEREHGGSYSGTVTDQVGHWILSSDIGCDFIFLDGVVAAYELIPSEPLASVIEEMIMRFLEIDLVAIKAQTHATLTALRAILRYYEVTRRPALLTAVRERYALYRRLAMTETYENANWFGRPGWTEPCAVIDSYIVAVALWRWTGDVAYLEDAHHIFYNGMGVEQRYNGGFGCNTCAGLDGTPYVSVKLNEAHWCCTMRGGEGLSRAAQSLFFVGPEDLLLAGYEDCTVAVDLDHGQLVLEETTAYPYAGVVDLKVTAVELSAAVSLRLFIPSWARVQSVHVNGAEIAAEVSGGFIELRRIWKPGDAVALRFEQATTSVPARDADGMPGYVSLRYGPLVLGYAGDGQVYSAPDVKVVREGLRRFRVSQNGVILEPVYHMMDARVWKDNGYKRQVLFRPDPPE